MELEINVELLLGNINNMSRVADTGFDLKIETELNV
jgi:hypothetical protein